MTLLAPAMDVAVIVDESGSLPFLCNGSMQCYEDEKNLAMNLVTRLDSSVDMFSRGGTVVYVEFSTEVNIDIAFTNLDSYLDCE